MLFRIIYCSRSKIAGTSHQIASEIALLLEQSKLNNEANDITGALFFNGNAFAQVMEGSRSALDYIFGKIRRDTRHTDIILLEYDPVFDRCFLNWTMAYVTEEEVRSRFRTLRFDQPQLNPQVFATEIFTLLAAAVGALSPAGT